MKRRLSTGKQVILGLTIVLVVLVISGLTIFYHALYPYRSARREVEALVKQHMDLSEINHFAIFHHQESYYSLEAKGQTGESLLVLVPQDGRDILVYQATEGIKASEAEEIARNSGAQSIQKTTFGLFNQVPVWEVYADGGYYYIGFEEGDLVSEEGL
ncbi:uncharacterized protein YpmB [Streptococcus rupicaprae]|uniref:Uncharacterized protein YpmB n=1 Tax=Streptococcus rupicaprae TaxID=759619 RepID=A0ABV2FJJ2_9STRE